MTNATTVETQVRIAGETRTVQVEITRDGRRGFAVGENSRGLFQKGPGRKIWTDGLKFWPDGRGGWRVETNGHFLNSGGYRLVGWADATIREDMRSQHGRQGVRS